MPAYGNGPMDGLAGATPEMGEASEGPVSILQQAIALHEGHMNGSVETNPESQQQLMALLTQALSALSGSSEPSMEMM